MKLIRKIESKRNKKGKLIKYAIFKCIFCLKEVERQLDNGLRNISCGCHHPGNPKHNGKGTRLYSIWLGIKGRCLTGQSTGYHNYGGRGITVCPEWTESYITFRDWSLSHGYQESLEIDRIDNNGNYEPSNCQWLTRKENTRKRRDTKLDMRKSDEIRSLYKTGNYKQKDLALEYNISIGMISLIINNKNWKN